MNETDNVVDNLTRRNETFAGSRFSPGLKMMPSMKTMVIGCIDPRVDPADVLGLAPGEAAVIRNIGGRLDPATLQTMALMRTVAQSRGGNVGAGWNLIVLHHTDCGIVDCHVHAPVQLAKHLAVEPETLDALAIGDPHAAVALDVAALKANPKLPAEILVTGLVYDVASGLVETVVPTAPLRPAAALPKGGA
ncbi:carbonic anhydrase [Cupriavidus sp. 30B13]|uniref:carbonic anhydrase n=1 Tax=Cupriavidus sp. 30B13 TaxID=3384241 RepID=UPI003B919F97